MRFKTKDLVATALVVAVVVPYGIVAYLVMERGDTVDRADKTEIGLAAASLALGAAALALAETTAAEVLLACFMGSILVVWAVKLMDHASSTPGVRRHVRRHA